MRDFGWDHYTFEQQPRVIIAKIYALTVAERLDALEARDKVERKAKKYPGRYSNVEVRHNPQRR